MCAKLSNKSAEESELLAEVANDDQRAFRRLYDRYYNNIYKYALHLLKSEKLAEENVQETFLKLWNVRKEATTIINLESYLVTISRNHALDALRRSKLIVRTENNFKSEWVEGHNQTEEHIILNETRSILQDGINLLPQQQKQVYELCHQQGMKYDEAAEKLGISTNTVKLYMKLSLRFLRDHLRKHQDITAILIILKLF